MVGGRDAKIGWGWACQTNNRVRRDLYWSGVEVVDKDRLQSPRGNEKAGVLVVECREWKIGQAEWGFALPNGNRARGARYLSVWMLLAWIALDEAKAVVMVEHQEWKIGRGRGFALPNRKSSASRSVSVRCRCCWRRSFIAPTG